MKHESVEKNIDSYHKATILILEKLMGIPLNQIHVSPIILNKDGKIKAFLIGNSGIPNNMDFMIPFITNGAFSLEISLKYLILLETKEWIRGHNLAALYIKLKKQSEQRVREEFSRITTDIAYKKVANEVNAKCNNSFSWDPLLICNESSNAFEKWRYSFESVEGLTWFAGYTELWNAIHCRINEVK